MWPYWLMLFLPVICIYLSAHMKTGGQRVLWRFILAIFIVLIGFRHQVGGDWFSYVQNMDAIGRLSFLQALSFKDPGYYALNWLVGRAEGTVYWVNFICAVLMMYGVSSFAKNQPLPWLALMVAVPYLLIVVAMGYTRQSAALGLVMVGLTHLGKHNIRQFVLWVLLGALFHKSAVLLLPIAALSATRNRWWTFFYVGMTAAAGTYFLVIDSAEALWETYVVADYQSSGGLVRVAMNALPSAILLMFRKHLFYNETEKKLWLWMAIFSLVTVPLVMISSTALDRVALYFIPLQLFVFSRFPLLVKGRKGQHSMMLGIVAYYAVVQFVWLNYASHSDAWLPYQNYLFMAGR